MKRFLRDISALWKPHIGQREFLLAKGRVKVLACGRRWGKTDACAIQVLQRLHRGPPGVTLLVAPTYNQAMILVDRVYELAERLTELNGKVFPLPKRKGAQSPRLSLGKVKVVARSGHSPRLLRGYDASHIIVDEAAYLPRGLLSEVLWPMLATHRDGTMTLISTPHGLNEFWRWFDRGRRGERGIWAKREPSERNPHVDPHFLEFQRENTDTRTYAQEYDAEFIETGNALIPLELIEAAISPEPPATIAGPISIGIDWGRHRDYTAVIAVAGTRDDARVLWIDRFNRMSWERQLNRLRQTFDQFPEAHVLCDQTGSGDSLVEFAQIAYPLLRIEGFVFSATSKWPAIQRMADLFDRLAIRLPDHSALIEELQAYQIFASPSGTIRTEAAGGTHDDLVIALTLACLRLGHSRLLPLALGRDRNAP